MPEEKKHSFKKGTAKQLLKVMEQAARGDFSGIDDPKFSDTIYGNKLKELIIALKKGNNGYVMRMNETMREVGDNALIKHTFEQVKSQTEAINRIEAGSCDMESSLKNISVSMGEIKDNTKNIAEYFKDASHNMSSSIELVSRSADKLRDINRRMQDFKEKTDKIGEIADIVKKITLQSSILALNASVEAGRAGKEGKGFAVVAEEMRKLSVNTSESAEKIANHIKSINVDINELASEMNETVSGLDDGNRRVGTSLDSIEQMYSEINDINNGIKNISDSVDSHKNAAVDFSRSIEELSENYRILSDDCLKLGVHIFSVGRYIDNIRNDMAKRDSKISAMDWMYIFEVDHFVLMWRVYNNIIGFEHLKSSQVENSSGCKLGKWLTACSDNRLTESREFKELNNAHTKFHFYAYESWKAKEAGNNDTAMEYFSDVCGSFEYFKRAAGLMRGKMKSIGYNEKTEIVSFKKH